MIFKAHLFNEVHMPFEYTRYKGIHLKCIGYSFDKEEFINNCVNYYKIIIRLKIQSYKNLNLWFNGFSSSKLKSNPLILHGYSLVLKQHGISSAKSSW